MSNDVEKSHAKNDSGESNEVVTEIDEVSTETSTKETTDSTLENMDKLKLNDNDMKQVKELESDRGDIFENESDGYLMLEKAIASGIELDNDMLDKILEGMGEELEPSKDKGKEKKKKPKKTKRKASFPVVKVASI